MPTYDDGLFAVICEFKNQAPLLMEAEGEHSSFEACQQRQRELSARPDVIRTCVVSITAAPAWAGNTLLLADMKRMQK